MIWVVVPLLALGFVVLAPACWRAGRGLVPVWRRLLVAAALAALIAVPALPTVLLGFSLLRGVAARAVIVPDDAGAAERDGDRGNWQRVQPNGSPDLLVVAALWISLLGTAMQCLRLPRRFGHLQQLPPVDDPSLVARIRELAARLGLRPPLVLEPATVGAAMQMQAFATGMLAPVVVVSDGIVHRLRPEERDAILAHELAHVRHRSVLRYLTGTVLVTLAAVLFSGFVPLYVALLWWLASLRLLRTLIGHRDELRADLTAARCVGFTAMANALDKTHAAHCQLAPRPWFHALLTHPALAVRALHLALAAPVDERTRIAVDPPLVRRCLRVRRLALFLWITLLAADVALGLLGEWIAASALAVVLLIVPLLPYLAFLRELRESLQLHGRTFVLHLWRKGLRFVAMITAVVGPLALSPWLPPGLPLTLAVVCLLLFTFVGRAARRAHRELHVLLLQRDLTGYLERFERMQPRWQRRPEHRLQALLVRAALGQRQAAVDELHRLRQERPRFREALVWDVILASRMDPPRAVVLARELLAAVPGNSIAEGTLANVLRRAGHVDEAWQRIQSVLRRCPDHGEWHAAAALIASARGDRASAVEALATAEQLDVSGSITVLARAEIDVAAGAPSAAASVQRLRELAERVPFAFLGDDATRLEGRLAAASAPCAPGER